MKILNPVTDVPRSTRPSRTSKYERLFDLIRLTTKAKYLPLKTKDRKEEMRLVSILYARKFELKRVNGTIYVRGQR